MAERVEIDSDDFKIAIEDKRVGNWSTEVDALIFLIENFDNHGAEKRGDTDAGYKFYDRVLTALATHYGVDVSGATSHSLKELLSGLIDECAAFPFSRLNENLQFEE